jgi:hypothetical protein
MATHFGFPIKKLIKNYCGMMLLLCLGTVQAQALDIAYDRSSNTEKKVKIKVFKSIGAGINTQGVVEITTEALSIKAALDGQVQLGLSLFSNFTLFGGNLESFATRASHLLYPYGGVANGQLYINFPLRDAVHPLRFLGFGGGRILDVGIAMPQNQSSRYHTYTAGIGVHQQIKSWESQDKSSSGFFWLQPTLHRQWMRTADSVLFFNGAMQTEAFFWGLQAGLEVNRRLRLTLFINQYLSKHNLAELNTPQLRLNFSYRFVPKPKKIQLLELN